MNENTGTTHAFPTENAMPTPLMENQYVSELFNILNDNGRDTAGLYALLGHVSEMENFVKRAEDTIASMKSQLAEMKELQNHPIKNKLQNAIKALETKVAEVKERLSELKNGIVAGCKNAVAAFKEKGIAALNSLASFFQINNNLKSWKKDINVAIKHDNKAIAQINNFATEYHTAGRAVKNMVRVAIGKEPIDAKKEAGKLAKTVAAPYVFQKKALTGLRKSINRMTDKLDELETSVNERKAERAAEKKPSLLEQLKKNKEIVEQSKRENRVQEHVKAVGSEL